MQPAEQIVVSLGHNGMTRHEFLRRILEGTDQKRLTKIAQHLAMAIVVMADGEGRYEASVRDLEALTGWSRSRISDHISELQMFMTTTIGRGKTKSVFELQGMITDALNETFVATARAPAPANSSTQASDLVSNPRTNLRLVKGGVSLSVQPADKSDLVSNQRTKVPEVPEQPECPYIDSRANTESPSEIVDSPLSPREGVGERELVAAARRAGLTITDETIEGDGFVISLPAVDLVSGTTSGMTIALGREIALTCALDWLANKQKPDSPMARVRAAIKGDVNRGAIHGHRLSKAIGKKAVDTEAHRRLDEALARNRRQIEEEDRH